MMIHPEIQAALVRERTRTFLADDGSPVLIRPVRPEDAGLLEDGLAGLRCFTDVDHRDHEALGALDHVRGGGVGIARYVRDREDPYAAEIAVTVIDRWQGRGLGTELLARLSERACQEGIRRFTAARWRWPACRSAGRVSAETRPAGWG